MTKKFLRTFKILLLIGFVGVSLAIPGRCPAMGEDESRVGYVVLKVEGVTSRAELTKEETDRLDQNWAEAQSQRRKSRHNWWKGASCVSAFGAAAAVATGVWFSQDPTGMNYSLWTYPIFSSALTLVSGVVAMVKKRGVKYQPTPTWETLTWYKEGRATSKWSKRELLEASKAGHIYGWNPKSANTENVQSIILGR